MHVAIDPAQRATDEASLLIFTLMVRGAPMAGTTEAALQFMDGAHDHLLRSFSELASDGAYEAWGRRP